MGVDEYFLKELKVIREDFHKFLRLMAVFAKRRRIGCNASGARIGIEICDKCLDLIYKNRRWRTLDLAVKMRDILFQMDGLLINLSRKVEGGSVKVEEVKDVDTQAD